MNKSNVHRLYLYLIIVEINCNNLNKKESTMYQFIYFLIGKTLGILGHRISATLHFKIYFKYNRYLTDFDCIPVMSYNPIFLTSRSLPHDFHKMVLNGVEWLMMYYISLF